MSKQKQAVINSDLTSKQSRAFPLAVVGSSDREATDEIGGARHTDLCYRNRGGHFMVDREETKSRSRRAQLTALSKVVNKAFTGWTIKTHS